MAADSKSVKMTDNPVKSGEAAGQTAGAGKAGAVPVPTLEVKISAFPSAA